MLLFGVRKLLFWCPVIFRVHEKGFTSRRIFLTIIPPDITSWADINAARLKNKTQDSIYLSAAADLVIVPYSSCLFPRRFTRGYIKPSPYCAIRYRTGFFPHSVRDAVWLTGGRGVCNFTGSIALSLGGLLNTVWELGQRGVSRWQGAHIRKRKKVHSVSAWDGGLHKGRLGSRR